MVERSHEERLQALLAAGAEQRECSRAVLDMAVACGAEVPEEIAALYDRGLTLLDLIEGIVRKFPVLRSVTGADVFLEVHCMCDEAFEAVTNWAEQAAILDNLQGSA